MTIDDANSNVLKVAACNTGEAYSVCVPRRGFRGEKFVATYKFKWNGSTSPGFLVRWPLTRRVPPRGTDLEAIDRRSRLRRVKGWLDNGNWLAVAVKASDSKARIDERRDDSYLREPVSPSSALSLSNGTWYTGKVVVDDGEADRRGRTNGNSAVRRPLWRGPLAREAGRYRPLTGWKPVPQTLPTRPR